MGAAWVASRVISPRRSPPSPAAGVALLVCLLISGCAERRAAADGSSSRAIQERTSNEHAQTGTRPLLSLTVRGLPVELDSSTTLPSVVRLLGGVVRDTGQTADYTRQLCYRLDDPASPAELILGSSVMGGDQQYITGYSLISPPQHASCSRIGLQIGEVQTKEGVHIGMSFADFRDRVPIGRVSTDSTSFVYSDSAEVRDTAPDGEQIAEQSAFGATARFRQGRLVALQAYKVTAW